MTFRRLKATTSQETQGRASRVLEQLKYLH